ncbi:MAG: hypothetical protein ACR2K1_07910, partial [Saprospiraceae bacterium]
MTLRFLGAGRAALIGIFLHAAIGLLAQGKPVVDNKSQLPPYTLPDPAPYSEMIRSENIKVLVDTLASATMFGRETGETGQQLAAAFIAAQFKALGLPPIGDRRTYEQKYKLEKTSWQDLAVKIGDTEYKNREDFYVFHAFSADTPMVQLREIVFVGYGIQEGGYNHYKDADVKGKAVLFYDGEPINAQGKALLGKDGNRTEWSLNWNSKLE